MEVIKWSVYGQVRGSNPSALIVMKWENFDPFSIEIKFLDTQLNFISL